MLIKIKTQEEFRSDHVTIEIVADRHELDSAPSDPGLLGAAAGRADRIQDLEAELASATRHADALERQVHLYDVDRKTEQERANRNQTRAEKAELRVTEMAVQIGKVNGAVHSPDILSALKTPWHVRTEDQHSALAAAVRAVRQAIGSPGPDTSPA